MTIHDKYQAMLACPGGLAKDEEKELRHHLLGCESCQEVSAMYRRQDALLQAEMVRERAPANVAAFVLAQRPTQQRQRLAFLRIPSPRPLRRWISLVLVGAVLALSATVAAFLPRGSATPANAYSLLRQATEASPFPYSGTAAVRYTNLDWEALPDAAIPHVGLHEAVASWAARDASHFRVIVKTVRPALDAGRITVVMNGRSITSYDSRTNTASTTTDTRVNFLERLQSGGTETIVPTPAESIAAFLQALRSRTSGTVLPTHADLVGRTTMLGRPVDVIAFSPVYIECFGGGTSGCATARGYASGRVWIDHQTHVILQCRISGTRDAHSWPTDYLYRVTSFQPGRGLSDADLNYQPPVPVVATRKLTIVPGDMYGYGAIGANNVVGKVPTGFLRVPAPPRLGGAAPVYLGTQFRAVGPTGDPTTVDVLYSTGRFTTTYFETGRVRLRFVKGPYLDVEERVQVSGLPASLRAGVPVSLGSCRGWADTYSDGQQRLAFAEGKVSVVMTTNGLSLRALTNYAAHDLCG